MFAAIVLTLYFIFIIMYLLISFFIVYHLSTYSIGRELRTVMLSLFILISAGLLFSNLLLFFSIDWNTLAINFAA